MKDNFRRFRSNRDTDSTELVKAFLGQQCPGGGEALLVEQSDGQVWLKKPINLRQIPVYLAQEDPRRKPSLMKTEDADDFGRNSDAKQVYLPFDCLFRCACTEGKWERQLDFAYVTLCNDVDYVEILFWEDNEVYFERYELTDQPQREDPSAQVFAYYEQNGKITITGVRHYCERLHIPARLEGKLVVNAFLEYSFHLRHLRELVVEEGVQKVDLPLGGTDLEIIRIPDSATLVRVPDDIQSSAWFRKQPDGPVYFHNYYCGTKGIPETDTLTLQTGTIGVIKWADDGRAWKHIQLPSTLTYIGSFGLKNDRHLKQVDFAEGTDAFKTFFSRLYPSRINARRELPVENCFDREQEAVATNGKFLYDLGRNSTAVKAMIPWEWLPSAPRLRYRDGWIAEYWYSADNCCEPGYYAALRVPSGLPVALKQLDKNAHAAFWGFWTDAYLPPEYLMAEDYLGCCAQAVQEGAPEEETLAQLNGWWEKLVPKAVLDCAKKQDRDDGYTSSHPRGKGYPWPMKPLPKENLEFWTWEQVKHLLLLRHGITEAELSDRFGKEDIL